MLRRNLFLTLAFLCSLNVPSLAAEKLKVVTSFSILADMASRVGGENVEVRSLVGTDADSHVYEPAPADAARMSEADVVIVNGLGFEGWLDRLVTASGYKGVPVIASAGIKPRSVSDEGHGADEGHGEDDHVHQSHGDFDPHAWQNVENAIVYVNNIRDALCARAQDNCDKFGENARQYVTELASLDEEIKLQVSRLPQQRRSIIMSHDAFGYFGQAYGIKVLAPEGVNADHEASAKDIARLIQQVKSEKVSALFVENISDPRVVEQISSETGLMIGGKLYSDALSSSEGKAPTYIDMMRHNAHTIIDAMTGT